jgi:transcriptional regulator with XRE-family HTH domain
MDELDAKQQAGAKRAEKFCWLLKGLGWNQSEAGRQLGVTSNHINTIVNGKCVPSESLLMLLQFRYDSSKQLVKSGDKSLSEVFTKLENIPYPHREKVVRAVNSVIDVFADN